MRLRNIGNSVAFEIEVSPICFGHNDDASLRVTTEPVRFIVADGEVDCEQDTGVRMLNTSIPENPLDLFCRTVESIVHSANTNERKTIELPFELSYLALDRRPFKHHYILEIFEGQGKLRTRESLTSPSTYPDPTTSMC